MTVHPVIRSANRDDAGALAQIERDAFDSGYSVYLLTEKDFAELVQSDMNRVFCCCIDGIIVGYAHIELLEGGVVADFDSLAVSPSAQNFGVGKALFEYIEQYCRNSNMHSLLLRIKENNYRLLKRYHEFGYKIFEVVLDFYEDGWCAIRMKKDFI
jgi:ribosomal protein S18 acetylase RimI-like enzyme